MTPVWSTRLFIITITRTYVTFQLCSRNNDHVILVFSSQIFLVQFFNYNSLVYRICKCSTIRISKKKYEKVYSTTATKIPTQVTIINNLLHKNYECPVYQLSLIFHQYIFRLQYSGIDETEKKNKSFAIAKFDIQSFLFPFWKLRVVVSREKYEIILSLKQFSFHQIPNDHPAVVHETHNQPFQFMQDSLVMGFQSNKQKSYARKNIQES